jgi:hypothetical protein
MEVDDTYLDDLHQDDLHQKEKVNDKHGDLLTAYTTETTISTMKQVQGGMQVEKVHIDGSVLQTVQDDVQVVGLTDAEGKPQCSNPENDQLKEKVAQFKKEKESLLKAKAKLVTEVWKKGR